MATLILESGLPASTLESEIEAMAIAARKAGVQIVGGDTKVVEHGKADGMYVTTFGIGAIDARATLDPASIRPGDKVLLSGPIGAHGITILLARGELDLQADLVSDTRAVWPFVEALLDRVRARHYAGCAIRRAAASRPRSTNSFATGVRHRTLRRTDSDARCRPRSLRTARARPAAHRQRGAVSRRSSPPEPPMRHSRRYARCRAAGMQPTSARCGPSRSGA